MSSVVHCTSLTFFINGKPYNVGEIDPRVTLYDFLKAKGYTSVKRVCGQGGCGACTVVLTNFNYGTNSFEHRSVNSCLIPLPSVAECNVSTSEGIGSTKRGYHAVQQRIARAGGTQCGYCTPGMVMMMYGVLQATNGQPTLNDIESSFDGNICRCTGYRPIIEACQSFAVDRKVLGDIEDIGKKFQPYDHDSETKKLHTICSHISDKIHSLHFTDNEYHWFRPSTIEEVLAIRKQFNVDVRYVVGNTSTGVYGPDNQSKVWIDLRYIPDLQKIEETEQGINAGAAVTLSRLLKTLKQKHPVLNKHIHRVASIHIRNSASWAGNFVMARTKGFPSDMTTILAGAGASISVIDLSTGKTHMVDISFFLNSKADYLVTKLSIPFLDPEKDRFQTYRSSIRHNNSHALVNAAFWVKLNDDHQIDQAILVFGVVDKYIKRAKETENLLVGKEPSFSTFTAALAVLNNEIKPASLEEYVSVTEPHGKDGFRHILPERFLYKFFLYLNSNKIGKSLESAINPPPLPNFSFQQTYLEQPGREGLPKREGYIQASGEAIYSAEIPIGVQGLHAAIVFSSKAGVKIIKIETDAAEKAPGVVTVITAKHILELKGINDNGLIPGQEETLATVNSPFVGQPIALVVAETELQARAATKLVKVDYGEFYDGEPIFDLETGIKKEKFDPISIDKQSAGDVESAFKQSDFVIEGKTAFGGQHPFYLERLSAVAVKGENNHIHVYTAAQNATMIQGKISAVLGLPLGMVTVTVKRCGGAFGGRLTRNISVAQLAAVASRVTSRTVRLELTLEEDMTLTAGRHSGCSLYKVGFTKEGKILGIDVNTYINAGCSTDLTAVLVNHINDSIDDIYYIPNRQLICRGIKTNLSSRTATRSFGHVQAKWIIESIIQHVAVTLSKPPHQIAQVNMYNDSNCISFKGDKIMDWKLPQDWDKFKEKIQFDKRNADIEAWNKENKWRKRGIYLTGVKYRITADSIQGMCHLTIYDDGTVLVIHGGCDPGTGVNTKVAQVVALTLGIPYDSIRVGESNTDITPKTGWNGGSAGIESQVEASRQASLKILDRLEPYKRKLSQPTETNPDPKPTWTDIIKAATADNMNQTITDYYMGIGSKNEFVLPQFQISRNDYFAWGVGCSEIEVDILTGEIRIIRSDIYSDVGNTINPLIDVGQSEGAFVFGLSYYLQEEEFNSTDGRPLYASTWTYKPFLGVDIPNDFRVSLAENSNYPQLIMGFKGVGEPPMVLSYSVVGALNQAIMASRLERGLNPWCGYASPIGIDKRALAGELTQQDLVF